MPNRFMFDKPIHVQQTEPRPQRSATTTASRSAAPPLRPRPRSRASKKAAVTLSHHPHATLAFYAAFRNLHRPRRTFLHFLAAWDFHRKAENLPALRPHEGPPASGET